MSTTDDSPSVPEEPPRHAALRRLAQSIGHEFTDLGLLDRALRHASTSQDGKSTYERLEFLGDAVLGYLVADLLFDNDHVADEGTLTSRRAAIVNRVALARVARDLNLGELLQHGRGLRTAELDSDRIQADMVEAVLGAIYCDGGVRPAKCFVRNHVMAPPPDTPRPARPTDPKSRLLHYAQANGCGQPGYLLLDATGPDHELRFTVAVELSGERVATAQARNKRLAQQRAAARALRILAPRRTEP